MKHHHCKRGFGVDEPESSDSSHCEKGHHNRRQKVGRHGGHHFKPHRHEGNHCGMNFWRKEKHGLRFCPNKPHFGPPGPMRIDLEGLGCHFRPHAPHLRNHGHHFGHYPHYFGPNKHSSGSRDHFGHHGFDFGHHECDFGPHEVHFGHHKHCGSQFEKRGHHFGPHGRRFNKHFHNHGERGRSHSCERPHSV